jgi:hypothetical protein
MDQETMEVMADLIAVRRASEVKEACIHMEERKQFGTQKNLFKITAPCEKCGRFGEYLYHEVIKICDECRLAYSTGGQIGQDEALMNQLLEHVMTTRTSSHHTPGAI